MVLSLSGNPFCRSIRRWAAAACALGVGTGVFGGPANLETHPLAPRSTGPGPTLFTPLPPEQTGVVAANAYDDPKMWGVHYREFSLGAIGTGVAIGDYDGDGRPDLFVVSKTGPNHLFRNLGGFRFEDMTEKAGVAGPAGPWKQGAAWADVNNDGRPDLYVCRFGAPNLLYINQGDGTFTEEAAARGLALADASNMAAFCDYDRDGWLDVYVQTNLLDGERQPNGQRDHLYHNNGDGTFTDVTNKAGITGRTQGHAATWWDFDEDGWPDLYVDNDFRDPDQFYHNNGDGTFTNVLSWVLPHTPHSSMGADLGDLDNDGHTDLLVADMAATTREKDHRGMAKLRTGLSENEENPNAAPQYMRNALLLGTGTARLREGAFLAGLAATDWTWTVLLEDFDLDGWQDAFFTNGMVRELHNQDLTMKMMTRESMAERIRVSKASPVLAEKHLAYRNLGGLRFEEVGHAWGLDQVGVGFGAATGDLDGDGDLDLVYASMDEPVRVFRNDGTAGHALVVALHGVKSNRFGVGATVRIETAAGRQMRTLTLARGYLSTSEPKLFFGLGAETVVKKLTVEWPGGARQAFENLAADQACDITEADDGPAPAAAPPLFQDVTRAAALDLTLRETPLDEWLQQPLLPFRLNRPGPAVAAVDFDGDGAEDFVLGGVTGTAGRLLSNLGTGELLANSSNLFPETSVPDGPIVVLDTNADGLPDLLVTKSGVAAPAGSAAYEPRLLVNTGRGRFIPAPGLLPSFPVSVGAAAAADFEHSGRLGIFLGGRSVPGAYPQVPRSALLAWRGDRYVDVTAEIAPELAQVGLVTAALWTDVDGDGWADLLVACEWGPVACFRNVGGKQLENATARLGFASGGTGWWHTIATADFNGDGRPDYAVGNTGLNTRYHASAAEPALLYAGVAAGGAAPQLVEAEAADGTYYPLHDRETLAKLMPAALRPFPTNDAYAKAKLTDVFPPAALAAATKLAVTELRNGVFLSQPGGTWRFTPLPAPAQLAPIRSFHAGDLDGDGRADLLAVGNSYAPSVETTRFDGGLGCTLRGDGRGGFTEVGPKESGFSVPGDARALVTRAWKADGWPHFLVIRNNDRALLFQHAGRPGSASFAVVLRGAPGNPQALGARLTVSFQDGATEVVESGGEPAFFPYRLANPPVRVAVRWPDGRQTAQPFATPPRGLQTITIP